MNKLVSSLSMAMMLCISTLSTSAQQVTMEAAIEKAITFLQKSESNTSNTRKASRKTPQLVLVNNRDEFYIFNDEANSGYVIVSGDERTPDILAYSDYGHYNSGSVPCNMQAVLDDYAEQISYLHAHPEYNMPAVRRTEETKVSPLLGETAWSQGWPYNNMCPTIDGKHCVTGCVVTATAQVMYYHKWPERGTGSSCYEWNDQTLSADFSQSVYRWDLMTPTYDSNSSQESCDAVALLMRDVGYACWMDYGLGGSSGDSSAGAGALIRNFDYDVSMGEMFRDYCDAESWHQFILDDLLNGLPVLYGGADSEGGDAHALVVDGYDGNGYFHFNFGWGGSWNGNYTMLSVRYNGGPDIHFGIKKNEGGKPRFFYGAHDDFVYVPETGILECTSLQCMGVTRAQEQHYIAVAVENTTNHEILFVDKGNLNRTQFQLSETLSDGNYILYLVGRSSDDEPWQKFLFYDERQSYVDLNVTNGVKTYTNNHLSDRIRDGVVVVDNIYYLLDATKREATVTYKNDKYGSYTGNVTIPSKISYKNQEYIVTTIGESAFTLCELAVLFIPKTVKTWERYALNGAVVDKIFFEEGSQLETIQGYGFQCSHFNSGGLDLPEGIKWLTRGTFEMSDIKRISLPSSLHNLYNEVFSNCHDNLRTIILNSKTPVVVSDPPLSKYLNLNFCTLYVLKGTKDQYSNADIWKDFGRIVEMEDTTTIDGIKYILGANENTATILSAFDVKHTTCTIPRMISYHGKDYKVTNLSPFAFINSPIEEVTIPNSVEYIGECALDTRFLKKLKLYHIEPPKVADMTDGGKEYFQNMFSNMMYTALIELYVPVGSKSKYQSDSFWGQFTNIVEDETLGMSPMLANPGEDKSNDIYSISGIRITSNKNALSKGIYIQGEKKIVK